MDNIKNDAYYLDKITKDISFIIDAVGDISQNDFNNNEVISSLISIRFIKISENISKLSSKLVNDNKDIPWHKIKGLRNRIVHDYDNINFDVIYDTIKNDFPALLAQLLIIIDNLD